MARKKHGTLVASTVATETVEDLNSHKVSIVNRGTDDIFVNHGPVAGDVADPTVEGDDTDVVIAGGILTVDAPRESSHTVKMISSGTPDYSVVGGLG